MDKITDNIAALVVIVGFGLFVYVRHQINKVKVVVGHLVIRLRSLEACPKPTDEDKIQ